MSTFESETRQLIERLTREIDAARRDMAQAIERYATLQSHLVLAHDRLERLTDKGES